MFPDVELVRSIQLELDEVIREGVANIVQLLRNTDSGTTSSATRFKDEDAFAAKTLKQNKFRRWKHSRNGENKNLDSFMETDPKKNMTEQLMENGFLSRKKKLLENELLRNNLMKGLHSEWNISDKETTLKPPTKKH